MNWLDRTVAFVSPLSAVKRVRARHALKVALAYEGARNTRATSGWITGGTSANSEIGTGLEGLRNRSRDLVRNNAWCSRALEEIVANVVGFGIVGQAKTGSDSLDKLLDAKWDRFVEECDADGQLDFYGLQDLVERTRNESGECLVRLRSRRLEDGFAVPLQLQVMEPDHLDLSKTGMVGGNAVIQGVEYDPIGRRVAYWLFPTHPGDVTMGLGVRRFESVRTPAANILHIYRKLRPGQGRGVPVFAPIIAKARDVDELEEAFLVRKKLEACFAAFRTTPDGADSAPIGVEATANTNGVMVESFEPGMIVKTPPGEGIEFVDPTSSGGMIEHMRLELHAIAAGIGVTYQGMTGDLTQVNYSSYRAGRISVNRLYESIQWKTMIPQFCNSTRRRFVDAVSIQAPQVSGMYGAEWSPPRFESVDPYKDAVADQLEVRSGFTTLPEVIRRRGYDPRKQIAAIAETNKQLDEAGLVLDSDPRKVAKSGAAQMDSSSGGGSNGRPGDDEA